jgi:hypothetical protein
VHAPPSSDLGAAELSRRKQDELIEYLRLSRSAVAATVVVPVPVPAMPRVELALQRVQSNDVPTAVRTKLRLGDLPIDPSICAPREVAFRLHVSVVARVPEASRNTHDFCVGTTLPL